MAKYKTYPEYRDSGVKGIDNIPTYWRLASLSKLFSIKAGGDLQQNIFNEFHSEEFPYPIYTNANNEYAIYGYTKKANYPNNTITVSGRGEVGFAVYRNHAYDAIIRLLVLVPIKKLECKYFAYFINSVINFKVESSAIGQLSTQQISPYKVAIPSLKEQRFIILFLDHETAKIDNLIEKQQQLIELLKEKRQAVISHAVTKGLNPDVPMKDSGIEWLDSIPSSWEVKPTYAICSASTEKNTDGLENNVLSLSYGNIIKRKTDTNFGLLPDSFNTYQIVKDGDIILRLTDLQNDKNSLRVGLVTQSGIITPAYLKLSVKHAITPSFSYYLLHTYDIFKVFYGMGGGLRQSMKFEDFRRLPLLIPSKIEQESIVTFIDKKIIKIDILIEKQLQQIALLKERRTALISAAVTGKIDVRHWRAPNEQTTAEAEVAV
ncbi:MULTISPECIES: restriction endonuclease subunit S [unclassified Citrobacter]|uniref:restriction endonuclease subunit S n=1 Tax=unclassified Citrobacter TaxID=2644389 RepID=UPI0025758A56|nr:MULTISPECIES: restriction endonuclease subunit S [unclassified Citrobacter]MDM2755891.1 restriction endonuclease subunit S [Citrobacter sp. Cpo221]MDM2786109.1 restriction endonuclease subunit S [Citrobacter sp. Cpo113]MDM2841268.1 restriction endonuclease subunit S [Citrobacter sp. Cpo086]